MKVLLDTHTLLWALNHPERLSSAARDVIRERTVELVCSAVAPWEIATKHRVGRLPEAGPLVAAFAERLAQLGARDLPITHRQALFAGRLAWEHRDPFDRVLAAQSILDGARLVTSDRVFSTLPGVDVFW